MRHTILLFSLCIACTPATPPPSPTPTPTPTPTKDEPAKEEPTIEEPTIEALDENDPERWRCTKDEDCTQTCALGAVSVAWLQAHPNADTCDDGCGWQWGKQACRNNECVTLDDKGNIDPSCTKLKKPLFE